MLSSLLVRISVGEKFNKNNLIHRTRLGVATSTLGILLNVFVTIAKVVVGFWANSMAIVSDGLHNLTDAFSSIVTAVGITLAGQPSDEDHPYGHGRLEYLVALVIAVVVLVVGIILARSAIANIVDPIGVDFSLFPVLLLVLSIGVKFLMYKFYKDVGNMIDSSPLKAASLDSIGDVAVTGVVLASYLFSNVVSLPIDGIGSLLVSLIIIKSGFDMIRDMTSELVGEDLDDEFYQEVLTYFDRKEIISTHDLNIHTYGPGVKYATIDAVVDADATVREVHQVFTEIEYQVHQDLDLDITIHMDIKKEDNPTENRLRRLIETYIENSEEILSYHDEDVTAIDGQMTLGVHLVADGSKVKNLEAMEDLGQDFKAYLKEYFPSAKLNVIIDRGFE